MGGIKIYKGRPILYSLENFSCDDLRTPVGADMFDLMLRIKGFRRMLGATVDEYPTAEGRVEALSVPVYCKSVVDAVETILGPRSSSRTTLDSSD
ncbi:hypothetical protein NKH43_33080 [Mesorhizobium sp. M1163]